MPVLLGKMDASRPGDRYYGVGAFPAKEELVQPCSRLDMMEDQVTNLQGLVFDLPLMVAVKALLIPGCSESNAAPQLFNEVDVVRPHAVLLRLSVLICARRP